MPTRSLFLAILATWLLPSIAAAEPTSDLTVRMYGMRNSQGQVLCALFAGSNGFPDASGAIKGTRAKVSDRKASCRFRGLKPGVYAVAVFHDEDNDGQMDKILGIPTEGFGFSNNAKPGMFGPPSYKEAAFRIRGGKRSIAVKMLYL